MKAATETAGNIKGPCIFTCGAFLIEVIMANSYLDDDEINLEDGFERVIDVDSDEDEIPEDDDDPKDLFLGGE